MSRKYYLGFSYGPRDCIGQKLATVEMRLALIHFLVKYEFFPTVPFEKLMSNVRNGLAIEARDGIWLDVKPRAERVSGNQSLSVRCSPVEGDLCGTSTVQILALV